MRKALTINTLTIAIAILTGVNLSIDEASSVLEILLQITIPVLAIVYKYYDQNGNLIPDSFEKKEETP
jgi:hypothetical protein